MSTYDLTRIPAIRSLLKSRLPLLTARVITLAGFIFTIAAGLTGSQVGSQNFAIIFVWIAWWSALKLVAIPFGGRSWCSICPIPVAGEWLQQGGLLGPGGKRLGLNRRIPKRFRNAWGQTGAFALMGIFSAVILTLPAITAWALLGLIALALVMALVFERRAFCTQVCPVGGFIGLYARLAPVEVRAKDRAICAAHTDKTCYTGSQSGYGCPWNLYPGGNMLNTNCGLCMECLRTCPYDNIAVNLRPFSTDLWQRKQRRLDEAFFGFAMLGSVLIYSAVMLGPWGALKSAAYELFSAPWMVYAAAFLLIILVLMPGLFLLAVWAGRQWAGARQPLKEVFTAQSMAVLPLGLMGWVTFTVSFAAAKFAYVLPVLSDPFGWGWDLLGTASSAHALSFANDLPPLQIALLAVGLFWTGGAVRRIAAETLTPLQALRQSLPVMLFCILFVLAMLWLLF